ncbi:ras-associating and dilute domain-containing protein isoform X3 [Nothobranchius furzeri]|uniref:ras-associating and dilute domain-containing protein isoform X3 n=1 Tax=Nothobranchius furzeri TaxID=105023 RepID=UPI00390469FD
MGKTDLKNISRSSSRKTNQMEMNERNSSSEEFRSLPLRPPGFSSASAARRFVRLGRKSSDGSSQSASSSGTSSTSRSAEDASVRPPGKSCIRHHVNRLSGLFIHSSVPGSGSMALTTGLRSSRSIQARKGSMVSTPAPPPNDPSELSNQITAPGILKIFGNDICEGAHYKSVLATTHSSAKELVKEALERYGLSKEEVQSYVLCDSVGSIDDHQWRTEGIRVVGDHEKPLLLQSLWKPREGLVRRFEIQPRRSIEEKVSKEKDTITAGINAQARKLQKSRSRVTSTLLERTVGRSHRLWRSKSEMDLLDDEPENDSRARDHCENPSSAPAQSCEHLKVGPEQNHIHGMATHSEGDGGSEATTEDLCVSRTRGEREEEESEREETESSDDNTTQYSIHPPNDCPYLLLLQGCSLAQDFIIYLLAAPLVVTGQHRAHEDKPKVDIPLYAGDICPTHCSFHRPTVGGPVVLCPQRDAGVTRNGEVLRNPVQLRPGDVIGLGRHYLFLFRDPSSLMHTDLNSSGSDLSGSVAPWFLRLSTTKTTVCDSCSSNWTAVQSPHHKQLLNRGPPSLKCPAGHSLTLEYQAGDEDCIIREIVAMGGGSSIPDRPPLTVSFLLSVCVQFSSTHLRMSALRRILLLIASGVQSAVWKCSTHLAVESERHATEGPSPEDLRSGGLCEVVSGLCPLVVWMANSLELLQFIRHQLPSILEWRVQTEQGREEEKKGEADKNKEEEDLVCFSELLELGLSRVRSASEETMAVLEEVIMLVFQQCVYYITKLLYPILPGLLDCNPFRGSPGSQLSGNCGRVLCDAGLRVPGEVRQVVELLNESWRLLTDCQVHPEVSSQLIGYLFYFINASLFNSLMERGSQPGFYQWSRGVHMRANLDLVLDWAHAAGLGELASEQIHTLSSAINLLATPRKNLLQMKPSQTHTFENTLLDVLRPSADAALPPSPPSHHRDDLSCDAGHILSQKLKHLDLEDTEASEFRRAALEPACLPSVPSAPHLFELQRGGCKTAPASRAADSKGKLVLECLAAQKAGHVKADYGSTTLVELTEEEEEEEGDDHDEVFSLALERGEGGLGLALVDTRDTSLKQKGVFIRAMAPDSPAARCKRLKPGDRILAVNGVSLLGLDFESGKNLIQSSGSRLRLLVARSACTAAPLRTGS